MKTRTKTRTKTGTKTKMKRKTRKKTFFSTTFLKGIFSNPRVKLRALGLLLADDAPTVGWGKTLAHQPGFSYKKGCDSETKSQKMVGAVKMVSE